ncbi:GPI-inositol-deacylase [Macrolepiota fuliginosa MF-IS2]|uniref:GPI inositol-deacylase n=1 Tax=Macrolepiota fuliginosa MF-IS2 TaxID=1400762 RepID=A0A9P5XGH3_9AGAR|nr:GPI-inositol-deacylase [Macrolepiota fuliginosa MF-IS2]
MPSTGPLALFAILAVLVFSLTNKDLADTLSPQGCRMSYMSPSYVLQDSFNTSWSTLAQRYSLWLYREVGWDAQDPNGLPVLFIPGNAGSSHQVRSIASSASRQYYSSPGQVSSEFLSTGVTALDFYAVEFNEDLSAFHGTTLQSQIEYTTKAVDFILSRYPPQTSLVILGHSMGGIVGTALLPSERVSAILTMSTPHDLPPARFDSRIDDIYAKIRHTLVNDTTPILSLCGGSTDTMIPSESCVQPLQGDGIYRKTIFTSALEGAWTGVGHREMVWCHQVRWRVARALLEMSPQKSMAARKAVLGTWFRDGHEPPPGILGQPNDSSSFELSDRSSYDIIPSGLQLVRKPTGSRVYLLPIPSTTGGSPIKLGVLVGRGTIASIPPQSQHPLNVNIYVCSSSEAGNDFPHCEYLEPSTLKLVPQPISGEPFPRPRVDTDPSSGGVDESDGVVLYETEIMPSRGQWVGVKVQNGKGEGWVVAGFNHKEAITNLIPTTSLLFRNIHTEVEAKGSLRLDVWFPRLLSNALIVYRLTPQFSSTENCAESHLAPLLIHTSNSVESHYYPLTTSGDRHILLHTHIPAPYHSRLIGEAQGLHLIIISSGISSCISQLQGLEISIDWPASLGRWASRYLITTISWTAGISAMLLFLGLGMYDRGAPMPSIAQSTQYYGRILLRFMLPASLLASFLPWPTGFYLGLGGSGLFAPLAPLILLIASGLVIVSWWNLVVLIWMLRPLRRVFVVRKHEGLGVGRSTIASMCIILMMVFLFVPWQVAYLGCWVYQLLTCAGSEPSVATPRPAFVEAYPLLASSGQEDTTGDVSRPGVDERVRTRALNQQDNYRLNCHILLFMTCLVPLAAPVLAVWVRTLITAGLTTPFDGDHFFIGVAPFLVLVDFASWTSAPIFVRRSFEDHISTRWALASVAVVSFLVGGTRPHMIFEAGKISVGILVGVRIGRRYWGGTPWTAS